MLEILSYKIDLWKCQRYKEKIRKRYTKLRKEAERTNKNSEEKGLIDHDYINEMDLIEDEIASVQQRLLFTLAEKYLIPTPGFDLEGRNWKQAKTGNKWRLTEAAISNLKDDIRKEQKERRERWQSWLGAFAGIIAALTGIVGALIGLLSVL